MPSWLDDALLITVLISILIFLFGIFRFLFKSGKRKAGAKLSGLSIIVFLVSTVGFGLMNSAEVKMSGFESRAVYVEAKSFGINDALEWEERKEELRQERRKENEQQALEQRQEEERQALEQEAKLASAAAEKDMERRKGFHCLSGWDGSHSGFKRQVKSMMRNPSSFEHISTRVTPVNNTGDHTVIMQYRAENGFGGMSVGSAVGEFTNSNCDSFVVLSVD
jgi:hypothetical protein